MPSRIVRRAVTLAVLLALVASAVAVADTVVADGDAVAPGNQATGYLGEVAPGAVLELDVPFSLVCRYPSHVAPGSVIAVLPDTTSAPSGGAIVATAGSIGPVPTGWPAPGSSCPGTGMPSLVSATPSHVTLTAPAAVGTGYEYTILYVRDPEDGLSSMTAVSFTLDVVEPDQADTTPPVLAGVPAAIDVETDDTAGATVGWLMPTAEDDTDPAPAVGCDPEPGSLFPVGTTTETCTATDASGNSADASFDITVRRHVPVMETWWAPPLPGNAPLMVGPEGRTVPVAVTILVDGHPWTPAAGPAPELRLDRMSGCDSGTAAVAATSAVGAMRWQEGRWTRLFDARDLPAGCWHLAVIVDGFDAGATGLQVDAGPRGLAVGGATAKRNR
jgi:HYR domain